MLTRPGRPALLAALVGDTDHFLTEVFERRPWLRTEGATGLPAFDLDDIDRLLDSALLRRPFFRVVRHGDTLPAASYTRTIRLSGGEVDGVVEAGRVRELMSEGATLVLES